MNLEQLLRAYAVRWLRRRYPPLVRTGWHNMRSGLSARSGFQAGMGAAMIALGYLNRRSKRRTRLYVGRMQLGESMRVRVRRGGTVVDDFTVQG